MATENYIKQVNIGGTPYDIVAVSAENAASYSAGNNISIEDDVISVSGLKEFTSESISVSSNDTQVALEVDEDWLKEHGGAIYTGGDNIAISDDNVISVSGAKDLTSESLDITETGTSINVEVDETWLMQHIPEGDFSSFIVVSAGTITGQEVPEDAKTNVIYLEGPYTDVTGDDKYKEWIVTVNAGIKTWTLIGSTSVDLSNKVDKSGDTMTGNLSVKNSSGHSQVIVKQGDQSFSLAYNTNGQRGIWDQKTSKWVILLNTNDVASFDGTATSATNATNISPKSDYAEKIELIPTATTLANFMSNCDTTGSFMNVLKTATSASVFTSSNNRTAMFSGRLNLANNSTLKGLLGLETYPHFHCCITRQTGFVFFVNQTTRTFLIGTINGESPKISTLGTSLMTDVKTAVGSSSQPVYVDANGKVTACSVYYA